MPNVMVLGGGVFGRWLGCEGGSLVNGFSVLIKETPQRLLVPSAMWDIVERWSSMNQEG